MIWKLFKGVLSAVLVAIAAVFLWIAATRRFDPWVLGIASLLLFTAAMPWVNILKPSRALGLVGIMLSLLVLGIAVTNILTPERFPLNCSARRSFCYVENLLYEVGGSMFAAAPFLLLGTFMLLASLRLTLKQLRIPGGHSW